MQKILAFVLVLAIGLGAGVPIGVILLLPQTPETPQGDIEGRITIEGISCTFTNNYAGLEIILLDHYPQTDLEGNVTIYQNDQEWTGEVDWHFDGSGYAVIVCDSINGNESFRIKYEENYAGTMYVDRTIDWDEVGITFTFMATEQISFTSVTYSTALNHVNITIKNTGTGALTIDRVLVNTYANSSSPGWTVMTTGKDETLDPNEAITIQVDPSKYPAAAGIVNDKFSSGDNYAFTVVTTKNNQFGPYTATASPS